MDRATGVWLPPVRRTHTTASSLAPCARVSELGETTRLKLKGWAALYVGKMVCGLGVVDEVGADVATLLVVLGIWTVVEVTVVMDTE